MSESERLKASYWARKEAGICVYGSCEAPAGETVYCRAHSTRRSIANTLRWDPEAARAKYREAVKNRVCTTCGAPVAGKLGVWGHKRRTRCETCLKIAAECQARWRARDRERRASLGYQEGSLNQRKTKSV